MTTRAATKPSASSINAEIRAYLAAQPPATRKVLKQISGIIRAAVPDAVPAFSYRIPAFKVDGKILVWYAGWKTHVSLYPIGAAILRANAEAVGRYKTSKGTIQFPLDEPLPAGLITRLVKARVAQARSGERI